MNCIEEEKNSDSWDVVLDAAWPLFSFANFRFHQVSPRISKFSTDLSLTSINVHVSVPGPVSLNGLDRSPSGFIT